MRFQTTHAISGVLAIVLSPIASSSPLAASAISPAAAGPSSAYWPYQTYHTVPFTPPNLTITTSGKPLAPGYLFFAQGTANGTAPNNGGARETAPLIMTDTGELVWNGPRGVFANNFKVDRLHGKPVLSYWSGIELAGPYIGHYYGAIHLLDQSYNQIDKICPDLNIVAPAGVNQSCLLDGHESYLTDRGTIIFTAYNITGADLSGVGGSAEGYIWNGLFFEMDLKTREIVFSWSALEHVAINKTKNPLGPTGSFATPFDYFHINSVQPVGEKYIISARHTWSVYLIDKHGNVEWTLQGDTGGDFGALPAGANFRWQHHARTSSVTSTGLTFHMFNNYNAFQGNGTGPSNGLILHLDTSTTGSNSTYPSPTLIASYEDHSQEIYSDAQGSFVPLPGTSANSANQSNWLAYYGLTPIAKEFGPNGDTRWTGTFGKAALIQSYRMYKQEWHGMPNDRPKIAVYRGKGVGYVSWNGATEVTKWIVYGGSDGEDLAQLRVVKKSGFETGFKLPVGTACVKVAAYGGKKYLGESVAKCAGDS